jgi:hypothetical protein
MSYYKCEPQSVLEDSIFKLYYDRSIIPVRTVPNNRPDVVMFDTTIKEAYLIYVVIPNSHNLLITTTERVQKNIEL